MNVAVQARLLVQSWLHSACMALQLQCACHAAGQHRAKGFWSVKACEQHIIAPMLWHPKVVRNTYDLIGVCSQAAEFPVLWCLNMLGPAAGWSGHDYRYLRLISLSWASPWSASGRVTRKTLQMSHQDANQPQMTFEADPQPDEQWNPIASTLLHTVHSCAVHRFLPFLYCELHKNKQKKTVYLVLWRTHKFESVHQIGYFFLCTFKVHVWATF